MTNVVNYPYTFAIKAFPAKHTQGTLHCQNIYNMVVGGWKKSKLTTILFKGLEMCEVGQIRGFSPCKKISRIFFQKIHMDFLSTYS